MLWIITGIIISYLIGSIPTAYIFGRLLKDIDIRKFGSGNVGATNAARLLGKEAGLAVLVIDIVKGLIAVLALGSVFSLRITGISQEVWRFIFGLSCICGHSWSVFLGFKGGKGIATSLGVLLGLAISIPALRLMLLLALLTWVAIFILTRIVSLASVLSALCLPVYAFILSRQITTLLIITLLSAFIILRHKSNITRLLQGKEKKFSFKKA